MNINGLLEEIDIEILRKKARNSMQKDAVKRNKYASILVKIEESFNIIKNNSKNFDIQLSFIEKIELKNDLKALLKQMQDEKEGEEIHLLKISQIVMKISYKYKLKEDDKLIDGFSKKEKAHEEKESLVTDSDEEREAAERKSKIEAIIKKKQELAREEDERKSRITLALEKKKAKSKRKIEHPEEKTKHESIMDRRIREMMDEYDRLEADLSKKISIIYDLQNDVYYANGEVILQSPKKLQSRAEKEVYIKSQMKNPSEFGYIFDKFKPEEVKALKYCDPYIVGILAAKDSILARDYVKQMAGTSKRKLSPIEFDITYDARGLENLPEDIVSKKEKSSKIPWYAAIPVVGAIAVGSISGATAGMFNQNKQNNDEDLSSRNSYSDTLEPGTIAEDEVDTTEMPTSSMQDISDLSTTTATSRATGTATTTASTIELIETTMPPVEVNPESKEKINKPETNPSQVEEQAMIINIGDKISVQEGLRYTADCLGGGTSNKIGAVSWRPATEYSVDRVAFVYRGKVLGIMNAGDIDVKQTLNSIAEKNGIEANQISTSVLLSLVPGIGDTGWAQISIEDMQENVSKPSQEVNNSSISNVDFDFDR